MNRNWKVVIIVLSALLCTIVICLAINISIGKITKNISASGGSNSSQSFDQSTGSYQSGSEVTDANGNTVTNSDATAVTDANGNVVTNSSTNASGNAVVSSNKSTGGSSSSSSNPLSYSKDQIISYYNACLNKSYSQPKMTANKSEKVTVAFDESGIKVNGETKSGITSIANMIVSANTKEKSNSKTFSNGRASDGTSASTFVLPTGLTAAGAASANIAKSGSGYKISITLVQESCDFTTMPPYNKSCAWPLNFKDIDFKGYAEIKSATFNYPGTKLTATVDGSGRVSYVQVDMPLSVKNGEGVITKVFTGTTVSIAAISGTWVCKINMSF